MQIGNQATQPQSSLPGSADALGMQSSFQSISTAADLPSNTGYGMGSAQHMHTTGGQNAQPRAYPYGNSVANEGNFATKPAEHKATASTKPTSEILDSFANQGPVNMFNPVSSIGESFGTGNAEPYTPQYQSDLNSAAPSFVGNRYDNQEQHLSAFKPVTSSGRTNNELSRSGPQLYPTQTSGHSIDGANNLTALDTDVTEHNTKSNTNVMDSFAVASSKAEQLQSFTHSMPDKEQASFYVESKLEEEIAKS